MTHALFNHRVNIFFCFGIALLLLWLLFNLHDTLRQTSYNQKQAIKIPPGILADHALRDVTEPINKVTDRAIFWHIPKSGGTTLKWYYGCLGLVIANEVGISGGHDIDKSLLVWEHANGFKYVNADTTGLNGISRAKSLGLGESGLADVMFTMFPHNAAEMFTSTYKGRFFTLIRHPIERSASMFYYRQVAEHEGGNVYLPHLQNVKLVDYLKQGGGDRNFMVTLLANKLGGQTVTNRDLEIAKEFLRRKFLVGLTSNYEESVQRFDHYFGFDNKVVDVECKKSLREGRNKNSMYSPVEEGSEEWDLLLQINDLDMQLYEYALQLFDEQKLSSMLR